jgi:hypothetical protein
MEASDDVAGGATVGLEDDRTKAALDALDDLLVLAVFGLGAAGRSPAAVRMPKQSGWRMLATQRRVPQPM